MLLPVKSIHLCFQKWALRRSWFDTGSCVRTPPVVNILYMKNRLQTQNRLQNRVVNSQNFLAALRAARLCSLIISSENKFSYFFQDRKRFVFFWIAETKYFDSSSLFFTVSVFDCKNLLERSRSGTATRKHIDEPRTSCDFVIRSPEHSSILFWIVLLPNHCFIFQRKNEKHSSNHFHYFLSVRRCVYSVVTQLFLPCTVIPVIDKLVFFCYPFLEKDSAAFLQLVSCQTTVLSFSASMPPNENHVPFSSRPPTVSKEKMHLLCA